MSTLDVWISGEHAGTVRRDAHGDCLFACGDDYLSVPYRTPLSVTMPLDTGDYPAEAWLDGLLPDNPQVRRNWAAAHSAASTHPADLLATSLGLDCAGAVQICTPEASAALDTRPSGVQWLTDRDIEQWITEARREWAGGSLPGGHGQFSLSGEQAKCALHHADGRWGVPFGQIPTTHILKPGLEHHAHAEVIEHVCMAAARALNLDAARTEIRRFGAERVLVVERFDRTLSDSGIRRLHQEDLCQAFGLAARHKYQADGGPTPEDIARLLRQESVDPDSDVSAFMAALVYNFAIAAPDGHAKNYSIFLDNGLVRLAPSYDVISYFPCKERTPYAKLRTAMKLDRDYALSRGTDMKRWARCAQRMEMSADATADILDTVLRDAPAALADAADSLSDDDRLLPEVEALLHHTQAWCKRSIVDLCRSAAR